MALDEFSAMYHGFKDKKILKKLPHLLIFLPPLSLNFKFSCLQYQTVIIYMLFNSLIQAVLLFSTV